jgi:rare lipoprotein A (peptidoglycan hydrolase)
MLKTLVFCYLAVIIWILCLEHIKFRNFVSPIDTRHINSDEVLDFVLRDEYSGLKELAVPALKFHLNPKSIILKYQNTDVQYGVASWYGQRFHGRTTANGEVYNMFKMTAAHKSLPFNTKVSVKNVKTGQSVIVRINDRGPYIDNRIIDMSYKSANLLGIRDTGTALVVVTVFNNQ